MRIAVVGLGGVGGYLAACFARAELDVIGFARGEHLNVIQTNGIRITEDDDCWSQKIDARALEDLDGFFEGYFDVVLFCVKSYDLEDSYRLLRSHINEKTILLSFSNGVTNGDLLRKISYSKVLDGCIYILSHIEESGAIRKKGKVFAAIFGGDDELTKDVAQIFENAKLRYKTPSDIQTAIWKKYIFISAFATATSFFNKSISRVYEENLEMIETLLEEIAKVAHAKGIEIFDEVPKALETASKVPADSSTSMQLDFKNKKEVELESLSGYIVEEGLKRGVKTPLMAKMYKYLKSKV
ncbi:ketopantoate reductase family protein [Sulfurimonas sp.]